MWVVVDETPKPRPRSRRLLQEPCLQVGIANAAAAVAAAAVAAAAVVAAAAAAVAVVAAAAEGGGGGARDIPGPSSSLREFAVLRTLSSDPRVWMGGGIPTRWRR